MPNEERFPVAQFDLLHSLGDVPMDESIVNAQFQVCDIGQLCGAKRLVTVKDVEGTGNESARTGFCRRSLLCLSSVHVASEQACS